MRFLMSVLTGLLFAACGSDDSSSHLASTFPIETHDTVLTDLVVVRQPGGIAGDELAITIKGTIRLGENPCRAAGKTAELEESRQGETLVMRPVIKTLDPREPMCTEEYQPITKDIAVTWKGSRDDTKKIVVMNVERMNETVTIEP